MRWVDDISLLERVRRGDETAFTLLFERYKAPVYRYAVHMGGAADADDVVQDSFVALIRQADRFDAAKGTLQGYLIGIARRITLRRLGRVRWEEPIDQAGDRAADPFEDGPIEGLSRAETIRRVRTAVAELPPAFREAVVLCELNELPYAEAAGIIGCPIGTIRSRLHRARAQLARTLHPMRPMVTTHE